MISKIPNLIIVAGDGRKSGKTTMCCRVIREYATTGITAIKISPHFHEPGVGLSLICEKEGFAIYRETSNNTGKDSSKMLCAGADQVFYIQVKDGYVPAHNIFELSFPVLLLVSL